MNRKERRAWLKMTKRKGIEWWQDSFLRNVPLGASAPNRSMEVMFGLPDKHTLPTDPSFHVPFRDCPGDPFPSLEEFRAQLISLGTPRPVYVVGSAKSSGLGEVTLEREPNPKTQILAKSFALLLSPPRFTNKTDGTTVLREHEGVITTWTSLPHGFCITHTNDWSELDIMFLEATAHTDMRTHAPLTCYMASIEMGDIISAKIFSQNAKILAFRTGLLAKYAHATLKWARTLALVSDLPYITKDVVFVAVEAGEAFEMLATKKFAGAARNAALCYKLAAMFAHLHPGGMGPHVLCHPWNCLGIALKRQGHLDMAERAYRYAVYHRAEEYFNYMHGLRTPESYGFDPRGCLVHTDTHTHKHTHTTL